MHPRAGPEHAERSKPRDASHMIDPSDLMRRLVKEKLLDFDGRPLFPEQSNEIGADEARSSNDQNLGAGKVLLCHP